MSFTYFAVLNAPRPHSADGFRCISCSANSMKNKPRVELFILHVALFICGTVAAAY